jgi:transposase
MSGARSSSFFPTVAGLPGRGGDGRQLVLDRRRDRGGRLYPQARASAQGEADDGQINKTDKLDARGLNTLQRNGPLPTVWIPPGALRDQRELPRTRMVLVRQRTQLKNRLHATLAKYALHGVEVADLFGVRGRELLRQRCELLPPHTASAT